MMPIVIFHILTRSILVFRVSNPGLSGLGSIDHEDLELQNHHQEERGEVTE